MLSIIISSFNRINLFRRVLWNIVKNAPNINYEVVIVDEESSDDIQGMLEKEFASNFLWKLVKVKTATLENKLGKKYLNNPGPCYNIGFLHSVGDIIAIQGNECLVVDQCYNTMLGDFEILAQKYENPQVFSHTYNMPEEQVATLDFYGSNLTKPLVRHCMTWPLQSPNYKSEVVNYLSMCKRSSWEKIDGFDERYFNGISSEDSDFTRRVRALNGYCYFLSKGITIHMGHSGKNCYQESKLVSKEFWDKGVEINHKIFHAWNGKPENPQGWKSGQFEVEVITNLK